MQRQRRYWRVVPRRLATFFYGWTKQGRPVDEQRKTVFRWQGLTWTYTYIILYRQPVVMRLSSVGRLVNLLPFLSPTD